MIDLTMSEKQVKDKIKRLLKRKGIYYFMPIPLHNKGVPDFILCLEGRFIAIECKSEKRRVTPHQAQHLASIRDSGGEYRVVRPSNVDEALDWIDSKFPTGALT